jgi:hypothetical protein
MIDDVHVKSITYVGPVIEMVGQRSGRLTGSTEICYGFSVMDAYGYQSFLYASEYQAAMARAQLMEILDDGKS